MANSSPSTPPNAAGTTVGVGLNDSDVATGYFIDGNGATRGFVRFADGSFNAPLIAPNDNSGYTRGLGINNTGTVVGDFLQTGNNTSQFHGYILKNGNYTQYDIGGPVSTSLFGINNNGHLAGTFGSSVQPNQGFLDKNGVVETFTVNPALPLFALGLNDLDQVVGQ
jgi:hypothetical protein